MKKLITLAIAVVASIVVNAATPFIEIRTEFWGKKYFVLNDVNGVQYKFNPPVNGQKVRIRTKTGWYEINSSGVIVSYKDPDQ